MPVLWWSTLVLVVAAMVLYWRLVSRLKAIAPNVLLAIDPHGFRALHFGSQIRFAVWLARGSGRALDDREARRTGAALRAVLAIAVILPAVTLMLPALTNAARDVLASSG